MKMLIEFLLFSGVVVIAAKTLPGIRLKSNSTALLVAVVYSVLNLFLGGILRFFLPDLFFNITFGLLTLVINTFLLWLTDKILDSFEITSLKITFLAALLLTVGKMAIRAVLY